MAVTTDTGTPSEPQIRRILTHMEKLNAQAAEIGERARHITQELIGPQAERAGSLQAAVEPSPAALDRMETSLVELDSKLSAINEALRPLNDATGT